jgi:hypothetical protein
MGAALAPKLALELNLGGAFHNRPADGDHAVS